MILFLDFDGVTHPEPSRSEDAFCRLDAIEEILKDYPAVDIVISSAWRLDWQSETESVANLREHFSLALRERVVGVTPDLAKQASLAPTGLGDFIREWECLTWLKENRSEGTPYVILDDRYWWFTPANPNLMIVDCDDGFMPEHEDELRAHLTRMQREMASEAVSNQAGQEGGKGV